MRRPTSKAAASASFFSQGKNMVVMTTPSPSHSISGLIFLAPGRRSSSVSAMRTFTLSSSSSSSMKTILSGSSRVQPPIRAEGFLGSPPYCSTLFRP